MSATSSRRSNLNYTTRRRPSKNAALVATLAFGLALCPASYSIADSDKLEGALPLPSLEYDPGTLAQCTELIEGQKVNSHAAAVGYAVGRMITGHNDLGPSARVVADQINRRFYDLITAIPISLRSRLHSQGDSLAVSTANTQTTGERTKAGVVPLVDDPVALRFCLDYVDLYLEGESPCFVGTADQFAFCQRMIASLTPEVPAECAALPAAEAAACSSAVSGGLIVGAALAGFSAGVCIEGCITGGGPGDGLCDLADLFCGQDGRNWMDGIIRTWF